MGERIPVPNELNSANALIHFTASWRKDRRFREKEKIERARTLVKEQIDKGHAFALSRQFRSVSAALGATSTTLAGLMAVAEPSSRQALIGLRSITCAAACAPAFAPPHRPSRAFGNRGIGFAALDKVAVWRCETRRLFAFVNQTWLKNAGRVRRRQRSDANEVMQMALLNSVGRGSLASPCFVAVPLRSWLVLRS